MAELTIARKNPGSPLTASEVKAALKNPPPKGERRVLRETGLILRIDDTGTGCWAMERKILGEQMRRAIGYSDKGMGLAEARREAAKVYASILAGSDPLQVRRQAKAQKSEERRARRQARAAKAAPGQLARERAEHGYAPSGTTLRDLIDRFQVEVVPRKPIRGWYQMRRAIEHHFGPWLERDAAELTDTDVRNVLARSVALGRPVGGKRSCQYAGRIYRWALAWKVVPADPFAAVAYDDLLGGREQPRERSLSEAEVARLWRAAEAEGGVFGSLAQLYLLTAARREEIAKAYWADIVEVYDELHREHVTALAIPTTKNNKPHHLPLSAKALEIINAQPRTHERVFPMTSRPNWPYHLGRLLKAAQIEEHATWHDLRRTASSMLASIGTDDLIREMILAHTLPGKLRRTYVTYRYLAPQRDALEALATRIATIAARRFARRPGRLTDSERRRLPAHEAPRAEISPSARG